MTGHNWTTGNNQLSCMGMQIPSGPTPSMIFDLLIGPARHETKTGPQQPVIIVNMYSHSLCLSGPALIAMIFDPLVAMYQVLNL